MRVTSSLGSRLGVVATAALATLAAPGCDAATRRPANVLLIVIDTLRSDHLGCYGSERDTSPALDAFAADAVRFDRAYATAPWTKPSVASILSGLYPSSHGTTRLLGRLPDGVQTLAEILRSEGYATAGVVSHLLLSRRANFQQGFDAYRLMGKAVLHEEVLTDEVTRQAQRWLVQFASEDRPFFLFAHYFDPHYQYKRHPEVGFAPPGAGRLDGSEKLERLWGIQPRLTSEEVALLRAIYDEEIRHTDSGIGRLLDTLRDLDLYRRTLIVVTADHGEEFMAHGRLGHGHSLYEELVRVPLIVRAPGDGRAPRVVQVPVSLASVTPTILDLVGVDAESRAFHGRSLRPLLAADPTDPADADPVIFTEVDLAEFDAYKKAIATPRFKLIRDDRSGKFELYDLRDDRDETRDLAGARPELVTELRALLEGEIRRAQRHAFEGGDAEVSPDELAKLRSLGYALPGPDAQ